MTTHQATLLSEPLLTSSSSSTSSSHSPPLFFPLSSSSSSSSSSHVSLPISPPSSSLSTVRLLLSGLSCSSCSSSIERALLSHHGVQSASVSLLLSVAVVTFSPALTSPAEIEYCVEEIGFSASAERVSSSSSSSNSSSDERLSETVVEFCTEPLSRVSSLLSVIRALPFVLEASEESDTKENDERRTEVGKERRIRKEKKREKKDEEIIRVASILRVRVSVNRERAGVATRISQLLSVSSSLSPPVSLSLLSSSRDDSFSSRSSSLSLSSIREHRSRFFRALFFALPCFLLSMILPLFEPFSTLLMSRVIGDLSLLSLSLFLLSSPVFILLAPSFFRQAWSGLKRKEANMGTLVALGAGSSYLYGLLSALRALLFSSSSHAEMNEESATMFFETASTLLTFIELGKFLEAIAKGKASAAISSLISLQPPLALVVELTESSEENEERVDDAERRVASERELPSSLLSPGDVIRVKRGSRIAADSVVISGEGSVNESLLTGESALSLREQGTKLVGGSLCEEGAMLARVSASPSQGSLASIASLMSNAQSNKAPIEQFADRVSGLFVPIIVIISLVTFFVWLVAAVDRGSSLTGSEDPFLFAFLFAVSVCVIACPCALGLATPTAVMVASGVGARLGVLIKGGAALECAHNVNVVIFDKTGTLTVGKPSVKHLTLLSAEMSPSKIAFLLGSAQSGSEHPLGVACLHFARLLLQNEKETETNEKHSEKKGNQRQKTSFATPSEWRAVTGRGLSCVVDNHVVHVGSRRWMKEEAVCLSSLADSLLSEFESKGETGLCVAIDSQLVAVLGLADTVKAESASVIARLQKMGLRVIMCTGDHRATARALAPSLHLSVEDVRADCLPQDKLALIEALRAEGKVVAMIGDGVNDGPALAAADLGIALGQGTDVACEAASVVLVSGDLQAVLNTFALSRATLQRIRMNYLFALGYNALGIPVAAGLFYPWVAIRLPPELAALAMAASSVSVCLSSLALLWFKPSHRENAPVNSSLAHLSVDETTDCIVAAYSAVDLGCCACSSCRCASKKEDLMPSLMRRVALPSPRGLESVVFARIEPLLQAKKEEQTRLVARSCCSSSDGLERCSCLCGKCSCGVVAPSA